MVLVLSLVSGTFSVADWLYVDPQEAAEQYLKTLPDPETFRYVNEKGQIYETIPSDENGLYYLHTTNENGVEYIFPKLGAGFFAHLDYVYMSTSNTYEDLINFNIKKPLLNIAFWNGDEPKMALMWSSPIEVAPQHKLIEWYEGKLCATEWVESHVNLWYSTKQDGYWYFNGPFDSFVIYKTGGIYTIGSKGLSLFAPYQGKDKKEIKAGKLLEGTAVWDFGQGLAWIGSKGNLNYTTGFDKAVALNPKKGTKVELYADEEEALVVYKLPPDKNGDIKLQKIVPGENKDKPVDIEQSEYAEIQGEKSLVKNGVFLEGSAVMDIGQGIAWVDAKGKLCYTAGFGPAATLNPKKGTEVELYVGGEDSLVIYKLPPDKNGDIKLQKIVPGENNDKPVDIEQSEYEEVERTYTLRDFPEK